MRRIVAEWALLLAIAAGLFATLIGGIYRASAPYEMTAWYFFKTAPSGFWWAFGAMALFGVIHLVAEVGPSFSWRKRK